MRIDELETKSVEELKKICVTLAIQGMPLLLNRSNRTLAQCEKLLEFSRTKRDSIRSFMTGAPENREQIINTILLLHEENRLVTQWILEQN